jgi:MFS family permease
MKDTHPQELPLSVRPIIPLSIWAIGVFSLLTNASNIIIFTLSPLYLANVIGLTNFGIGLFEGTLEALTWFIRPFSGVISDFWGKRKPLLLLSAFIALLSRPILAWSPNVECFFLSRSMDRVANGLQATPRDALVGDHAPKALKGASYGLRQTLGVLGSLLGALALYFWLKNTDYSYTTIFWWTSIPSAIALLLLWFLVKDSPQQVLTRHRSSFSAQLKHIKNLKSSYWAVIGVAFIYTLSHYSAAFIILQAQDINHSINPSISPQIMIYQNLATMLFAFPIGQLSDHMDRRILLAFGFIMTIVANAFIGFASNDFMIIIGSILWGGQLGITQSLFLTKVADHARPDLRGTAFGIYYLITGFSIFLANSQTGWISHHYDASTSFLCSSFYALIAIFFLPLMRTRKHSLQ